jgi:hypothetical protein
VRFIKIFGYILIIVSVISYLYSIYVIYYFNLSQFFIIFSIVVSTWYLVTGIGILIQKEWGYYLFKIFLYILLVSFPIGTIISYICLKYIKNNNIKDLFGEDQALTEDKLT